jgi:hypothetical protein
MMLIELASLGLTRARLSSPCADTQGRHSAIHLLIAETYTPFLAQMKTFSPQRIRVENLGEFRGHVE